MKEVHLVAVGKLKDQALESLEQEYLGRLSLPKVSIFDVKTRGDREEEGTEVVSKIESLCRDSSAYVILLEEQGKKMDSPKFSEWFYTLLEKRKEKIFFVLGGAEGHGERVKKMAHESLSLSSMTFPHKLARILLIEQIYRAQTIETKHPYHKSNIRYKISVSLINHYS